MAMNWVYKNIIGLVWFVAAVVWIIAFTQMPLDISFLSLGFVTAIMVFYHWS